MLINSYKVYGCFHAIMADLSCCSADHMDPKTGNIYCLLFAEKFAEPCFKASICRVVDCRHKLSDKWISIFTILLNILCSFCPMSFCSSSISPRRCSLCKCFLIDTHRHDNDNHSETYKREYCFSYSLFPFLLCGTETIKVN